MNGSAPNCSKMGSQTRVMKKSKPNLWRGSTEPRQSSNTSRTVIKTTEPANKKVMMRAISSPSRRRLKKEREPTTGPAPGTIVLVVTISSRQLLNVVERLQLHGDDFLGKPSVSKGLGVLLSIIQHPFDEALDGIALSGVGDFLGNQEPGKAGDGIGRLSWGV